MAVGGSPGLVVLQGDSCPEGRGCESHKFAVKIVMFENTKINEKDAGFGP